ncbi:MAG TPA: ABC transporter ATP-binding protein [Candidatus Acidoferrales bacterium]|jgi:ATP-binding cassette subfamily B multidrug efflux pump|nr:ABC transporter ATP-binding protein [Candidatus Acidoferrales bacterium]
MWDSFGTLRKYLWRYRWGMATGGLCLVLKDLAHAAQPLMIGGAVDAFRAFQTGAAFRAVPANGAFIRFAAYLVGLAAVKGVFQYWMRVIIIGISRDIEYDLRNDLFRHLIALSPDYYGRTRTGDIMARATNDLNAVRMMLGPGVMYWFETSLTFALAIAIMVRVDWRLAFFAVLPAPAVSFAVIFFGRRIHDRFEKLQAMFSDISSRVQENLSGVRMIRAFAQEKAELRRFEELNRQYIAQNIKLVRIQGLFQPLLEALIGMTFLVVLWVGGHQVLLGRISVGSFVMFNTYMGMLVWPMIALGWVVNLMQRGRASLDRINQILHERPAIGAPVPSVPLGTLRGEIEFRGVEVHYGGSRALDGLDLRIAAGSTVAVVGRTGSGKSTLVGLIPRLMDPTAGAVLVDGIDLRQADPAELRRHIGFVPQETFLFSATIAGNIAFGVDTATPQQIRRAAELAGLASDIETFPKGYETMVGERGITLSGGQKQRTAIARAILRDPRILILDDALSSVDTMTEERILTHLAGVMRGRTVILISHRVSTVRQADRIVVLERGRIVEQGTHAELVEAGGYYAELSRKQMLEEELEAI